MCVRACDAAQVNVADVNLRMTLLGHATSCPVYITATALRNLAHADGEV